MKDLDAKLLETPEELEIKLNDVRYVTFTMDNGEKVTVTKLDFFKMLETLVDDYEESVDEEYERISENEMQTDEDFLRYYQDSEYASKVDLFNALNRLFSK